MRNPLDRQLNRLLSARDRARLGIYAGIAISAIILALVFTLANTPPEKIPQPGNPFFPAPNASENASIITIPSSNPFFPEPEYQSGNTTTNTSRVPAPESNASPPATNNSNDSSRTANNPNISPNTANDSRIVINYFYSSSCPFCKDVDAHVRALAIEHNSTVRLRAIDIYKNQENNGLFFAFLRAQKVPENELVTPTLYLGETRYHTNKSIKLGLEDNIEQCEKQPDRCPDLLESFTPDSQ